MELNSPSFRHLPYVKGKKSSRRNFVCETPRQESSQLL